MILELFRGFVESLEQGRQRRTCGDAKKRKCRTNPSVYLTSSKLARLNPYLFCTNRTKMRTPASFNGEQVRSGAARMGARLAAKKVKRAGARTGLRKATAKSKELAGSRRYELQRQKTTERRKLFHFGEDGADGLGFLSHGSRGAAEVGGDDGFLGSAGDVHGYAGAVAGIAA